MEHLTAHGLDVDAETVTLGPWLRIDPENERFRGNAEANRLAHGFYRDPYTVPEITV
jgi:hypothetical protein